MKSLLILLFVLLISLSTQQVFNYHEFLEAFGLLPRKNFSYEKFVETFFGQQGAESNVVGTKQSAQSRRVFNYKEFVKTFFKYKNGNEGFFDFEAFQKTFRIGKVVKKAFDYKMFLNVFKLKDFDIKRNLKSFGNRKFDINGFLTSFGLKRFDFQRFQRIFKINSAPSILGEKSFDIEGFRKASFERTERLFNYAEFLKVFGKEKSQSSKGVVLIVDDQVPATQSLRRERD